MEVQLNSTKGNPDLKFHCLSCGTCCRNLLRKMKQCTVGLSLLPDEMSLFPEEHLAPMWGVGVKGRSRPRPEAVGVIQLDTETCPHLTPGNQCRIYDKRPLMCRAYPLKLNIDNGIVLSASINKDCKGAQHIIGKYDKLSDCFTEEIVRANTVLNAYFYAMLKQSGGLLWLFDLDSKKWKRVTLQTVPGRLELG